VGQDYFTFHAQHSLSPALNTQVSSLPGHLDDLTLGNFASLGITLHVPEGRPKDLSALGR
jgi:hypothetical protein